MEDSMKSPKQPVVTTDERHGGEMHAHEAFGTIIMSVPTGGGMNGLHLFGSDIGHHQCISIEIHRAELRRDLSRDWIHSRELLARIEMSHAQFAQFITSAGNGGGTPCTLRYTAPVGTAPEEMAPIAKIESKHETHRREIQESAAKQIKKVQESLNEIQAMADAGKVSIKELRAKLFSAKCHIENLPSSLEFAIKSAEEALEKAASDAKIEVESYVQMTASRLGLKSIADLARIEYKESD
jgi:hypothetical protein